jgi:hypothetical protein
VEGLPLVRSGPAPALGATRSRPVRLPPASAVRRATGVLPLRSVPAA